MSRTILLVGATSALAKEVLPILAKNNTVITAGRHDCDLYCDVTKEVVVPGNVDVIINFAASFVEDKAILESYATNVLGALRVCMGAKQAGVQHLIQISSMSAVLPDSSPYYNTYALTKRQGDEAATFFCAVNGMPLMVLRPSQIYGNTIDFSEHQPFFYEILDMATKGEDVTIYGSHDALRNYIHASDLAEVLLRVIEKQVAGTYSCTYPTDTSYSQIAQTARAVFKRGGSTKFLEQQHDIPDNVFGNDMDLYDELGYTPQISLEAGIRLVKQYREGVTS